VLKVQLIKAIAGKGKTKNTVKEIAKRILFYSVSRRK